MVTQLTNQNNTPEGWKNQNPDEGNVLKQNIPEEITNPEGWKSQNPDEGEVVDQITSKDKGDKGLEEILEEILDELRMKWAGTSYEIVLEKLEMLDSWKGSEGESDIKNAIIEWMLENDVSTLMEEGEDILDGLELMTESGEVSTSLLIDCTEIITTLIVARKLDSEEVMPTFQKAGTQDQRKKLTRQNRAKSMNKIRKELVSLKNQRKPFNLRTWAEENFQDMEIKKMKRR